MSDVNPLVQLAEAQTETVWINITTYDGELLERFTAPVYVNDLMYPLGSSMQRADILAGIESGARIAQARARKRREES